MRSKKVRSLGPANDTLDVLVEIRAAELAHRGISEFSHAEWIGWARHSRDFETPLLPSEVAGWLAREIVHS